MASFVRPATEYRGLKQNAAILPRGEREKMIDEVLGGGLPTDAGPLKADLKEIVQALIVRKQALFADNIRKISNFELTETASGFHLSVASTL